PGRVLIAEWISYLSARELYYCKDRIQATVYLVKALPIILLCNLCWQNRKYYRVNESTFWNHFREIHLPKLKMQLVVKCPICSMWFNNINTAKNHAKSNHSDVLKKKKKKNACVDFIDRTADKSKAINYKDKEWTVGVREVQCFANLTKPNDCFTCSLKPTQK
ncbi:MAG: hypothetical protein MJE68_27930, partial [Proteobacteria bacterium]|nr:hypothetical protein [Pseudomonadota bacterium]